MVYTLIKDTFNRIGILTAKTTRFCNMMDYKTFKEPIL